MQRYACTWWLLPGNHDFARNSGLWDRVRAKGAANIRILAEPVPCELEPGQWLLPAPLDAARRHASEKGKRPRLRGEHHLLCLRG